MDKEHFLSSGLLEQYALGLTTPEENREVERYLEAYPELNAEVEGMRKAISQYAHRHSIPPANHFPPAKSPEVEGTYLPSSRTASGISFSWIRPAVLIMAAFFGILALVLYRQNQAVTYASQRLSAEYAAFREECLEQQQQAGEKEKIIAFLRHPKTLPVTLHGTSLAPDAEVIVYWNATEHKALLNNLSLPTPPAGKQYQIWADVDGKMINIGLLDRNLTNLQSVSYIERAVSLNITLEPKGGSHEPTVELLYVNGKV